MEACRTMSTEEILALPDVQERIEVYYDQTEKFKAMVHQYTRTEGNVIITDLRGVDPIYTGNRFMIYSMYPEQNISAWIVSGRGGEGCSAAVGYSIMNRICCYQFLLYTSKTQRLNPFQLFTTGSKLYIFSYGN